MRDRLGGSVGAVGEGARGLATGGHRDPALLFTQTQGLHCFTEVYFTAIQRYALLPSFC